jgi:hypothetical protein
VTLMTREERRRLSTSSATRSGEHYRLAAAVLEAALADREFAHTRLLGFRASRFSYDVGSPYSRLAAERPDRCPLVATSYGLLDPRPKGAIAR